MIPQNLPRHIVLMGPPGSGKSTHGETLSEMEGVPLISVGSELRHEADMGTPLGLQVKPYLERGDLCPSSLVGEVVRRRLNQPDAMDGFVLDGFPRRLDDEAILLDWAKTGHIHDLAVVGLQVPYEEIIRRVQGRRICPNGHSVNIETSPPRTPDHCNEDGLLLTRRPDDDPAVVRHRLDVYHGETEPVIDSFKALGIFHPVDGVGTPAEVQSRIQRTLLGSAAAMTSCPALALVA